jgi:hypothetical protein
VGLREDGHAQVEVLSPPTFAHETEVAEPRHLSVELGHVVLDVGAEIFVISCRNRNPRACKGLGNKSLLFAYKNAKFTIRDWTESEDDKWGGKRFIGTEMDVPVLNICRAVGERNDYRQWLGNMEQNWKMIGFLTDPLAF